MRHVYHIVTPAEWRAQPTGPYQAASLATEGFTHCSNREQVAWVANSFFAAAPELLVLRLDTAQLTSPLRDEDIGTGERFPHIYGPIDRAAVAGVEPLQRTADGQWSLPPDTAQT